MTNDPQTSHPAPERLLTMMPWKQMIIALEQLRAGHAVADSRASAPIAPEAEEYSESTNHSKPRSTNDGTMERSQCPMEIQNALDGTHYFDKTRYKAIYWYLIAKQLKSGELRNAKIYKFNPDVVYNQARSTKNQEQLQTGIPPPGKKHSQTAA